MSGRRPTLFIAAGEPSGDLHGAGLARALRARLPDARLLGLGGSRMAAEGVELLAGVEELAVMGFVEVLRHLPFFIGLRRRVFSALEREGVDLVVPIDYPGFNLRLARHARQRGIPVLYYISPQVWAWHAERTRDMARDADVVAVVLPFEEKFLRDRGVNAVFVGHPLLDLPPRGESRAEWAARAGLDPRRPVLALFPGSRPQEVRRHLSLFSAAAERVAAAEPAVQPVVGIPGDVDRSIYAGTRWPLLPGASGLLEHADAALVKSGTTTLETALAGTPAVVAYRMNPLSYAMAKRLVKVPHIALANLIAEDRVFPEFVQEQATPESLAAAILPLLDGSSPRRREMVGKLAAIRAKLAAGEGEGGAAERTAAIAARLLEDRGQA
ncbi:MAG TPA: lipid-A-disaccharide synthase [Longimicrobiaceae bacterium]|nr:lipid-A-disaccharide synthase [Longimicrobiaceae bacterium]